MIESPVKLVIKFIKKEKDGLYTLLSYTLIAGFMSLVVPLGAQALVNSLAAGVLINPLLIITLFVFLGLLLYGMFQLAQIIIVEKLQQKIFAHISVKLALHIPQINLQELKQKYSPSMANRFFEVMTLQKSFAKICLHWPSAILQVCLGLVLIWIYNIYLVAFSIIILIFMTIIYILGKGSVNTSIKESSEKYNVAAWIDDLARCHFTFKTNKSKDFVNNKTDQLILKYLYARKQHFKIILRQYTTYYIFYAIASVGILAIGGWLVIDHKLSLGQLVASELIIVNILRATETVMNFIDSYYDLIAGVDKINYVLTLKTDKNKGELINHKYIDIKFKKVSFGYDKNLIFDNFNIHIKPGEKISFIGKSGIGKTSLTYIIYGALAPTDGNVYINDINIKEYDLTSLRSKISMIGSNNEIFRGTIRENITITHPYCSTDELNDVLSLTGLDEDLENLPDGLETNLVNKGLNISFGQRLKILIARAIIKQPYLIILDDIFLNVDENTKSTIIKALYDSKNKWTIIDTSYDYEAAIRSNYIYAIDNKNIIEHGTPQDLFSKPDSFVRRSFNDSNKGI